MSGKLLVIETGTRQPLTGVYSYQSTVVIYGSWLEMAVAGYWPEVGNMGMAG